MALEYLNYCRLTHTYSILFIYILLRTSNPFRNSVITSTITTKTKLSTNNNDSINYVDRRVTKIDRVRSSPLSQRWYKNKQQYLSKFQKHILREQWSTFGVDLKYAEKLDFKKIFYESTNQVILDIGFGSGDSIVNMASEYPSINFLGY